MDLPPSPPGGFFCFFVSFVFLCRSRGHFEGFVDDLLCFSLFGSLHASGVGVKGCSHSLLKLSACVGILQFGVGYGSRFSFTICC